MSRWAGHEPVAIVLPGGPRPPGLTAIVRPASTK